MRLKFFFFPIVLILCITVGLAYIWPEFTNLKLANSEYTSKRLELEMLVAKKSAASQIDDKLKDDVEGSGFVKKYLPLKKSEDLIIAEINHIAPVAQVSLLNITPQNSAIADPAVTFDAQGNPIVQQAGIKTLGMKISVSGSYDNLHSFFDKIQKIAFYNSIKSISILPVKKEKTDTTSDATVSDSGLLDADLAVDFGYMEQNKFNASGASKFDINIDKKTVDDLKSYVYNQNVSIEAGSKGRTNPFVK